MGLTTKRRLLLDEYIKKAYLDFTPFIFDRQDFPFFTPNQKNMVVMARSNGLNSG